MKINNNWNKIFENEFKKEYFINLENFLEKEYNEKVIYPPYDEIFKAFTLTDFNDVKVLILGQDPYINENQANGLAFSVNEGEKLPPSLKNIFKELKDDLDIENVNGDLTKWAKSGVLLLNTTLTVEKSKSNSHSKMGWTLFTDNIIRALNNRNSPIVFLLWGNNAIAKKALITNEKHLILTSPHPSPLSARRGFFGCKHFSKTNEFLINNNYEPINWHS